MTEEGGTQTPKCRALLIPRNARLNKYGNLPLESVKRLAANPTVFSGKPKGGKRRIGIYRRINNNTEIQMLVDFSSRARHRPRLGFRKSAERTSIRRMSQHVARTLTRAFKTARR